MNSPINNQVHATYPNLGSIIMHFERPATESGSFIFQLQEKNTQTIYYKGRYSLSDIYHLSTYPFGFKPIINSKNKTYIIDIQTSELSIKKGGIVYELVYSFDREQILRGEYVFQFVRGKLFQYWNGLINSHNIIFFISPSLFYLLFSIIHFSLKENLKKIELFRQTIELLHPSFLVLFLYILYDILFIPKTNDFVVSAVCAMWILLIYSYRFSSQKSFILTLFFMSLCPLLLISNMQQVAEKTAVWAYVFMTVGAIHAFAGTKKYGSKGIINLVEKIYKLSDYIVILDSQLMFRCKKIFFKKQKPIPVKMNARDFMLYILRKIKEYIFFMFYILIFTIIVLSFVTVYTKVMGMRDRELKNPIIKAIEPTLVYPATKVILFGNCFGSKIDGRYRLMRNGEELRVDYWEDHKIIFTIPLGWKTGFMNVWVERPVQWNGETIIEKTKEQQIKLLPVTSWSAPDDDLYFEQMKKWKKETREINGYE
jgi:hypothetical protein